MSEYNFYYDESEHSRKINQKTITADNYYDNFIAVVVGWRSEYETDLFSRYTAFEEKYKYRQSKGELKSTTIRQSQLERGFSSLNNENVNLLEDFLALFDEQTLIYYSVISKIEYKIKWENWSEEHGLLRKAEHDKILEGELTKKPDFIQSHPFQMVAYDFGWGQISSEYDTKSSSSYISFRYL